MAGTRKYRRKSNGQFAGSGGGTVTTTGRSGGFASASHRANVAAVKAARIHTRSLVKKGVKIAVTGAAIGGVSAALAASSGNKHKGELSAVLAKEAKQGVNTQLLRQKARRQALGLKP
jgi:hypothetical protein